MERYNCTCHCGGAMFYRHLHAESCVLSREGEEAPKSELQTLRDERDRLRSALEDACLTYAVHGEQPPEKWLAALTPAGGGQNVSSLRK